MAVYGYRQDFFEPISNVTTANSIELGSRRIHNGNEYVYVYNGGGKDISTGRGAIVTATSGYTVTVSSASAVDQFFGVCRYNTITTAAYGWLMTRGFADVVMDTVGSATAGAALCAGTNGLWRSAMSSTTALGPGAQARAMTAAASGDSGVGAWIYCQ
jgi:hypothetical protein